MTEALFNFKHYFTLITQKAYGTYNQVLRGAAIDVLWSYVVEETGIPGGKPPTLDKPPLPCHRWTLGIDPGSQG